MRPSREKGVGNDRGVSGVLKRKRGVNDVEKKERGIGNDRWGDSRGFE